MPPKAKNKPKPQESQSDDDSSSSDSNPFDSSESSSSDESQPNGLRGRPALTTEQRSKRDVKKHQESSRQQKVETRRKASLLTNKREATAAAAQAKRDIEARKKQQRDAAKKGQAAIAARRQYQKQFTESAKQLANAVPNRRSATSLSVSGGAGEGSPEARPNGGARRTSAGQFVFDRRKALIVQSYNEGLIGAADFKKMKAKLLAQKDDILNQNVTENSNDRRRQRGQQSLKSKTTEQQQQQLQQEQQQHQLQMLQLAADEDAAIENSKPKRGFHNNGQLPTRHPQLSVTVEKSLLAPLNGSDDDDDEFETALQIANARNVKMMMTMTGGTNNDGNINDGSNISADFEDEWLHEDPQAAATNGDDLLAHVDDLQLKQALLALLATDVVPAEVVLKLADCVLENTCPAGIIIASVAEMNNKMWPANFERMTILEAYQSMQKIVRNENLCTGCRNFECIANYTSFDDFVPVGNFGAWLFGHAFTRFDQILQHRISQGINDHYWNGDGNDPWTLQPDAAATGNKNNNNNNNTQQADADDDNDADDDDNAAAAASPRRKPKAKPMCQQRRISTVHPPCESCPNCRRSCTAMVLNDIRRGFKCYQAHHQGDTVKKMHFEGHDFDDSDDDEEEQTKSKKKNNTATKSKSNSKDDKKSGEDEQQAKKNNKPAKKSVGKKSTTVELAPVDSYVNDFETATPQVSDDDDDDEEKNHLRISPNALHK